MPRYSCGCVNEAHSPSGVLHSVVKCRSHRKAMRSPEFLGRTYYEEISAIVDGVPQCARYLDQIREALGHFPFGYVRDSYALEVGCGASMYAPGLLADGYRYTGLDESEWACEWTRSTFAVDTIRRPIEVFLGTPGRQGNFWDLILAAHVLEHLEDAPGAIGKLAGLLKPGGELWIIVPDDSDPVNPDHMWFWTSDTLRSTLESAGLAVDRMVVRKYVKHENFIYARARKPA